MRLLTDHSQRIITTAHKIVKARNSDWLSPIDIFLAIIRHNDQGKPILPSSAFRVLNDFFGIDTARLYHSIETEYGDICKTTAHISHRNTDAQKQAVSDAAKNDILTLADLECAKWGDNYIGAKHILLALLLYRNAPIIQSHLAPQGISYAAACKKFRALENMKKMPPAVEKSIRGIQTRTR